MKWQKRFLNSCILVSNYNKKLPPDYHNHDIICAIGVIDECEFNNNSFSQLKEWYNLHNDWMFGYISYDIKNEIEGLESTKQDCIGASHISFFRPKYVFIISKDKLVFESYESTEFMRNTIHSIQSIKRITSIIRS